MICLLFSTLTYVYSDLYPNNHIYILLTYIMSIYCYDTYLPILNKICFPMNVIPLELANVFIKWLYIHFMNKDFFFFCGFYLYNWCIVLVPCLLIYEPRYVKKNKSIEYFICFFCVSS